MHFYMRNAKQEDIVSFKQRQNFKTLGMPEFIAMGSHEIQQMKHRFIVLPRFGRDIWKIFNEQGHNFPLHTVYRLGWQILNTLQFIHGSTYVHGDIKGSNILLGFGKGGEDQAFLLDYGLACHYNVKDYKPDPKKMHNGTIEYTSRDAHNGVPTMRGDIEILAYNLIEYAGAKLPWVAKNLLNKPIEVQKLKEEFMKSTDKSLKSCFGSIPVPAPLANLLKYVESMKHDTVPDYAKLRGIFETGIKDLGQKNTGVLQFSATKAPASPKKKAAALGRPDFSKNFDAPKRNVDSSQPGPSNKATVASRTRRAKNYVEVSSEESDNEVVEKQKSPRKTQKKKTTAKSNEPEVTQVEQRAGKRNRRSQQYVVDSESEDEADQPKQSPKKKTRVESPQSSVSPLQKSAEKKKKGGSKTEAAKEEGTGKSTVTLKGNSKSSKNKKTYHLNLNLDVSLNSDVVVVLNRKDKDKKKKKDDKQNADDVNNSEENEPGRQNRAGFYKGKAAKTN